ncbi:F-box/kelch-repeat protein At3g06240-like [Rutidosis leptorrhynchoides]|uniref:F-box/kelch-repeat protein At3g06240-like n=1 Tax=Rutidosis leptorrhynchoides TaxID=125765 RepID=UPI003A994572
MSALNQLPPDLIEAILPFLPPKSLGRFKSVSKRWYSLISSLNFIKTHIRNYTKNNPNPKPTQLILLPGYGDDNSLYSVDIKQLNTQTTPATVTAKRLNLQEQWAMILGSCNGILLALDHIALDHLALDEHHNLYLVNPTTKKTLKVPDSGEESHASYGFGYDASTDDYKVISISRMSNSDSDANCVSISVYSLRNNLWRKLPNSLFQQDDFCCLPPGVFVNNNLHWVVRSRHSTLTIATFSLATEEFCEIDLPYSVNFDGQYCFNLFAFGGKLVAVLYDELHFAGNFSEMWVMGKYGVHESWMKYCIFEDEMDTCFTVLTQISNWDILLRNRDVSDLFIYSMDERMQKCNN